MGVRIAIALALSALAVLAGCGSTDGSTPVACLERPGPYLAALRSAPGTVELKGETPISGCLVENQSGGDLATVGTTLVAVTTRLNAEAREQPGGDANLQLG